MATVMPQSGIIWRPNRPAIFVASLFATAVVVSTLIFMFDRQPESPIRVYPIEIALTSLSALEPIGSKQRRSLSRPHLETAMRPKVLHLVKADTVPLKIIEPLPNPIDWQQQMEMSVKAQGQNLPSSLKPMSAGNLPFTPLQQALNAPQKPSTMHNGGSYRSIYGGVMLKSGGMCSELQTIQVGPSPSNRVTVAFPGHHCAGDYQPSMAEELSKWVDQEAKKHPPF
jgi:hypothetical protein